ncbi:TadE/TadG family type IV pilus assembly protein [Streptomyces sp. NPDC088725]|uniref:TadE/TadG family type IV pilus assembly protein n=1 Tax=Streptomyces sp. NPDC088725 TaxID=3365873 RepID=UPI003810D045
MSAPGTGTDVRAGRGPRRGDDRGQAAIEFTGMVPIILATLALLWQAALVGYAFSLAGNAADEAVRAGTVGGAGACRAAAARQLSGAWSVGAVACGADGDLYRADVPVSIPVLFPGFNIPVHVTGHAAAANEEG